MNLERELQGRDFHQIPIKVTSGVLLHIGAGIYSSVAGAIKELVSNSFDADATRVVISTDFPRFEKVTVVDNGAGMTTVQFEKAMQSIGSSLKRVLQPSDFTLIFKRPLIGHLGIGLMALTQVCGRAEIESQARGSDTKFVAHLDFREFAKRTKKQTEAAKLDVFRKIPDAYGGVKELHEKIRGAATDSDLRIHLRAQLELFTEANRAFKAKKLTEPEDEYLGYCVVYPKLPATPGDHGTVITLSDIDEQVRASLQDVGRPGAAQDWSAYRNEINGWPWIEICERLQKKTGNLAYHSLPKYHQFLWELSLLTPVEYPPEAPVILKPNLLRSKKDSLRQFGFSVLVDNRKLTKPVLHPSGLMARGEELKPAHDYLLQSVHCDEKVGVERLKYDGYIFWQRKQVVPSALRGIQIYIRNVGIGLYDPTLLGYGLVNPTSRAGQISGEIYVDEGLERALDVNRNSFRETDPHYFHLQQHVWKLLGSATKNDGVIGKSITAYWKRKAGSEEEARTEHMLQLDMIVREISNGRLGAALSDDESETRPYVVEKKQIVIFDKSPSWPRAGAVRRLSQKIIVSAQAALVSGCGAREIIGRLEDLLLKRVPR